MLRDFSPFRSVRIERIVCTQQGAQLNTSETKMKLRNKVAFITGGTSGIGLETAKLFQAEGATVVLVGSNDERLAAAGKELNGKALLVRADIRKVADISRAVEATRK